MVPHPFTIICTTTPWSVHMTNHVTVNPYKEEGYPGRERVMSEVQTLAGVEPLPLEVGASEDHHLHCNHSIQHCPLTHSGQRHGLATRRVYT